ncbi:MAG: phosphatidate cytidylyltransferase [Ardenticatenales bacterium]
MSNLAARVLSAVVMVPLIVAAVLRLPEPWWGIAVGLVAALAAREILVIAVHAGMAVSPFVPIAAFGLATLGGGMVPATVRHDADVTLAAVIIVVVVAFLDQLVRPPDRRSAAAWGLAVAVPIYVGGLASFLIQLRDLDDGPGLVLFMLFLVWTNDSAAYFGGRAFGRHPLAPALSPKKTWEGLLAGTVGTVVVGLGLAWTAAHLSPIALTVPSLLYVMAVCIAVSAAGPLGDLSHSFIKRQFGAKDSSHLIPGHGGVWDRIDSLLFAAPVVYLAARLLGA